MVEYVNKKNNDRLIFQNDNEYKLVENITAPFIFYVKFYQFVCLCILFSNNIANPITMLQSPYFFS